MLKLIVFAKLSFSFNSIFFYLEDPLRSMCGCRVKTIIASGHIWPELAGDIPTPPTPHLHHHLRAGDVVVGGGGELVLLLACDSG